MPRTTTTRLGKMADSVFAPRPVSTPAAQLAGEAAPDTIKTTIALTKEQMNWLVRLEADIRANTGASLAKTAMIRAAVEAMRESGIDFTSTTSEADLKAELVARLSHKKAK